MPTSKKLFIIFLVQVCFFVFIILFLTAVRFFDADTFNKFAEKYNELSKYDVSISLVYDGE